jgi:hypothetical protein
MKFKSRKELILTVIIQSVSNAEQPDDKEYERFSTGICSTKVSPLEPTISSRGNRSFREFGIKLDQWLEGST